MLLAAGRRVALHTLRRRALLSTVEAVSPAATDAPMDSNAATNAVFVGNLPQEVSAVYGCDEARVRAVGATNEMTARFSPPA